jgi:hypothetical protein
MVIVELSFMTTLSLSKTQIVCHSISGSAALLSVFLILFMPFRYPSADPDISSVGSTPNDQVRSPEDDLKLWQFLTVYWMFPLISEGRGRKLNEDDIWLLGYQFQHRRLFEAFQMLRGSVIARIIRANCVDIAIISVLALVDIACSKFSTRLMTLQAKAPSSICRTSSVTTTPARNGNSFHFFFHESGDYIRCALSDCQVSQGSGSNVDDLVWETLLRKI